MTDYQTAYIDTIDQDGRGIARQADDKVLFIDGALPGETVLYQKLKQKPSYDIGKLIRVKKTSPIRVTPQCEAFGRCGGCSFQHADVAGQVALKQRMLEEQLQRIGKVVPEQMMSPIHGPSWGYRYRARLSVRFVKKKGKVLVGFREKQSHYVADITGCPILPPAFSALLPSLAALIENLSIAEQVPQLELLVDDSDMALVLRHMAPLSSEDKIKLLNYTSTHGIYWFLQPGGINTIHPFPENYLAYLTYRLPEFDLQLQFYPSNFTQINPAINQMLIRTAMS